MKRNMKKTAACLAVTITLLAGTGASALTANAAEAAPASAEQIAAEQAAAEEAALIAAEQAAAEEAARIAAEQAAAEEAARIAAEQAAAEEAARIAAEQAAAQNASEEIRVLAQIMMHEALYEGEAGMIAVGEVVMNRVLSPLFPSSISGVVFQHGQFTSARAISRFQPGEYELALASGVAAGQLRILNNASVLYFRNARVCGASATSAWGPHAFAANIGNHSFYVQ